ncbi:MAG: ATP-binding cassette domain-containing protein [Pirellulales bacterium]
MQLFFDCRHRYAQGFALDVAFTAPLGPTALFGPSGSGKSTCLALIAGLLRPLDGVIRLGDEPLVDTHKRLFLPPERRGVGLVFQDQRLFPHLTVAGNLRYGQRRRSGAIDFAEAVEVLELGPLLERQPARLSGGERQRVALGRTLLAGPRLLLLDEPWTSLDVELRAKSLEYVQRVVERWQIPTLLVSHNRAEVSRLAPQVVLLDAGKVQRQGATSDLLGGACDSTGP